MERKAKRDFLFIDETGDPGADLAQGSSLYFVLGLVHVSDLSLEKLHQHLYAMGYFSGRFRELKSSRLSRLQKDQIEDIAKWLCEDRHVSISVVLVDKGLYTGPYLISTVKYPAHPFYFRNFLTRHLLEQHFLFHTLLTLECDIIFDRAIGESEEKKLQTYLQGNLRLPTFTHILHADSRYIPALQFTDAIIHIVKEYILGKRESVDGRLLQCLHIFQLNDPRNPVLMNF